MKIMIIPSSLVLLLACLAPAQTLVSRINCGGPSAPPFAADASFVLGSQDGHVGGQPLTALSGVSGDLIGGESNPHRLVYKDARVGWSAYRFNVPAGDYIVRLLLAEIFNQGAGLRRLDVTVEGVPLLSGVDLAGDVGVQYGALYAMQVAVSDGVLDVVAAPGPGLDPVSIEGPIINGIEVFRAPAAPPGPGVVGGFAVRPGYRRNLLTWDWNDDPNLGGYVVYRATSATGPFTALASLPAAPPRHHDDTAAPGTEYFYTVVEVDVQGAVGAQSAALPATAFDESSSTLPVYELQIAAADLEFISKNILVQPKEEVPATFIHAGQSYTAEVRFRGGSSRVVSKKSWKVKFPPTGLFQGQADLNLKASMLDPSLIRERTAFRLWHDVELEASEIRPVHLIVNGEYLGVFNQAEHVEREWLAARDRDTGGSIYKCEGNLAELADPADYEIFYDKKTNGSSGNGDLIALVQFLNNPPAAGFEPQMADMFDVDAYLTYLAVIGWTGDLDTIVQNYFLHHDLSLDRWELIPWDADANLGIHPVIETLSIMSGTSAGTPGFINHLREAVLLGSDAFLWRYLEKLRELCVLYANSSHLDPILDSYHAEVAVDAKADPFKLGWEDDGRFLAQLGFLETFVPSRTSLVIAQINQFQPASPPTLIWINELSAAGQTTLQDEAGELEDWVELHNAGALAVDIGGLYLTDDLGDPTKWQIPAATTIPAGGHVVIFCDDDPGDGPLHATFKLGGSGEELGLFDADGTTLLDFISWKPQVRDVTFGRYEDGKQFFVRLGTSTPGAANVAAGNLAPSITWAQAEPQAPRSTDSVAVSCQVKDADGVSAVDLLWKLTNDTVFTQVAMAPEGNHRYRATIPAQPDGSIVEYYLRATDGTGLMGFKPDDVPDSTLSYAVSDPAFSGLVVNEILASNDTAAQDEHGDFDDYVELYNGTDVAADVGGMYLTDDLGDPTQWQIPPGTVIPAKGFLLVWADDEPGQGPLHATFKLSAGGEEVGLFDGDGATLIDGYAYPPLGGDVAFARIPDGVQLNYLAYTPTAGASNVPAPGTAHVFDFEDPSRNPLDLAVVGTPRLGQTVDLTVQGGAPSTDTAVWIGLGTTKVDYGVDGVKIVKEISTEVHLLMTDPSGQASFPFPIPSIPFLVGIPFYAQSYVLGSGMSNGTVMTIGM